MTKEILHARLAEAQAEKARLLQQRASLADLIEQIIGQLNASQGRIAELTALIGLMTAPTSESPAGPA